MHPVASYNVTKKGIHLTVKSDIYESVITGIFKTAHLLGVSLSFDRVWYFIFRDVEYTNVTLTHTDTDFLRTVIDFNAPAENVLDISFRNDIVAVNPEKQIIRILHSLSFEQDTF